MENLENSYNIVAFILVAVIAVWLILKSISLLFKLFILLAISGVMYFMYQYYPDEVIKAGGIIAVLLVLIWLIKSLFSSKK